MAESGARQPEAGSRGDGGESGSSGPDFRRFAGRALFPRSLVDLTSTSQCPACQAPLSGTVCDACRLDLSHPAAGELATLSRDAAAVLDRRLAVIGRIRHDTALALTARVAGEPGKAVAGLTDDRGVADDRFDALVLAANPAPPRELRTRDTPRNPPPSESRSSPLRDAAVATAPRRSTVQVILLILGITLLSIAAIFFLVYAFINFGILGRSIVIAAVTIASVAIASGLRRRALTATAEGVAVLSVVLVYLDAFAIRANDFFGLGGVDGAAFWGGALVLTTVGFLAWNRLSGLRTPRIVGFSAIVPGVALAVDGLLEATDPGSRVFFALGAATLAGTAHRLTGRAERRIVRGSTGVALLGAFVAAVAVAPREPWASVPALLTVSALAGLHAWLIGRASGPFPGRSAAVFAGIGGVAAAAAVASGALRDGGPNVAVVAPPLAAVVITLALEAVWRRSSATTEVAASHRRSARAAVGAAATVAGIALLSPLAVAAKSTWTAVNVFVTSPWALSPLSELDPPTDITRFAVLTLVLTWASATAAWTILGIRRRRAGVLAWSGAAVLLMIAPLLTTVAAVLAGWLLLAGAAWVALWWADRRAPSHTSRTPLLTLLALSGAAGYLVSWGSTATWWIGSLAAVALLVTGRRFVASPLGRAAMLGIAAVILTLGAAAGLRQLALSAAPTPIADASNAGRAVSLVAIALLLLASSSIGGRLSPLDRRVVFWIAAAAGIIAFGGVSQTVGALTPVERISLVLPEPGTALAADVALFAALMIAVVRFAAPRLRRERLVASAALAPALSLVVDAFARVLGLPELVRSVGAVTAALLAAIGALIVARRRPRQPLLRVGDRRPQELGVVLVALPSMVFAVARNDSTTWLVLLISSLVVLILATSSDGLFRSVSRRRHLGWGSLALATAGLWWRLGDSRVTELEPYLLPLSGTLLIVAVFIWHASRSATPPAADRVAPVIALVALLLALLPLGAVAATGTLTRALLIGAVSAVLAIVGSWVLGTSRFRPYLDSAALAGVLGVLTVVVGRSYVLLTERDTPDTRLDGWLAAGLLVLITSGMGQARDRADDSAPWRSVASQTLGATGLAAVLGFEVAAFPSTSLGSIRAVAVILLFSALHVIAALVERAPFSRPIGWAAIGGAVVAVGAGILTGALDPIELGTVPVAVALLLTGALELSRVPTARTWPWLAPGVAMLLLPPLLATAHNPPLWRLIGLGIAGVAIIVVSVIARLQAPFLIGIAVVLVHAFATFAPQIRSVYASVEWWLWFVPVGIAVVVFAARFEHNMLRMRSVAMRIRALR